MGEFLLVAGAIMIARPMLATLLRGLWRSVLEKARFTHLLRCKTWLACGMG